MTYIIENANLYKQNQLITTSLLVDNGKILSVQPNFPKYLYMKMSAKDFIMTSTSVFYADGVPQDKDTTIEQYMISRYLGKGCTTVLVSAYIKNVNELDQAIEEVRNFYKNSPLDYTIAVKIPIKDFTVPFVLKCKRKKIPAIFIEFNDKRELYKIPWGWIREALFPYNSPLIPVIVNSGKEKEDLLQTWQSILQREKIPHIEESLSEQTPLHLQVLKKIGIYPLKGYLQTGGELSYNLYLSGNEHPVFSFMNDEKKFILAVTVHKGKIVKAGEKIYYNLENGEEFTINRPSFFS